jgi:exosortase/archaeosortase family protein
VSLQWLWGLERNSPFGHAMIEGLTVNSAVNLINLISSNVIASAQGTHITAVGGGINVLSGCDGLEVMFLLIAAMIISPLSWLAKLNGILSGLIFVFLLNQLRLVTIFYAVRQNKQLFELVHGLIAPIILVALTGLFLAFWLSVYGQPDALKVSELNDLAD